MRSGGDELQLRWPCFSIGSNVSIGYSGVVFTKAFPSNYDSGYSR